MTKRLYPPPANERLLPALTPFQPTHILAAPFLDWGTDFNPRQVEFNITSQEHLNALLANGWTVLKEIKQS